MTSQPGDLVLSSEVYSHVVTGALRAEVCDWCLHRPGNYNNTGVQDLKRCGSCKVVYYCDRNCQKAAWKEHKDECKYLQKIHPKIPTDTVRLICRILLKLQKGQEGTVTMPDGGLRKFSDLMTHEEEIKASPSRVEAFRCFLEVVKECLSHTGIEVKLVWQVYCRVLINSVEITSAFQDCIGTGLYIAFSAVDHSCKPNTNAVFKGRAVELRALEPSVTFSSARITYLNEILPTRARNRILQDQYYFTCNCEYCLNDYPQLQPKLSCPHCYELVPLSDIECGKCESFLPEELLDSYRCWREDAVDLMETQVENTDLFACYQTGLDLCKNPDFLMLKLSNLVFSRALAASDVSLVVKCLSYILPTEQQYYHKRSLALANTLSILSKGLFSLGKSDRARELFKGAESTVRLYYGERSPHHQYLRSFVS